MRSLADINSLIIDMDGVLYRDSLPMPRLGEFFTFLRLRGIRFILATNNSTHSVDDYMVKLAGMGARLEPNEILTAGRATALALGREYPRGTRMHVFGMAALRQSLADEGFVLADENVAVVVASMDRDLNYDKLKRACLLIRGGARFITTNRDATYPSPEGLLPGGGAVIAAIETGSGVTPEIIGKPEPTLYRLAMEQIQADPARTAVIGDRVETDLVGARRLDLATICVLSGASSRSEAEAFAPDWIFDDIAALLECWTATPQAPAEVEKREALVQSQTLEETVP